MSYRSFVAEESQKRSRLQNLLAFLNEDIARQYACRITCVEFSRLSASPSAFPVDHDHLDVLLHGNIRDSDFHGRLFIIEDLSHEVVEKLGSALNIDPLFFASHIDTTYVDIAKARPSIVNLPSTI